MITAFLTHPDYLLHTRDGHPESAARLQRITEVLAEHNMDEHLLRLEPIASTPEQLAMVHDPTYVQLVQEACEQGGVMLDPDTYTLPVSYDVARLAAGGALKVVDAVLGGQADNAFAALRPPGHHATPKRAMGFCLFNNIAIAARHAQQAHGLERVLIVDFDVHHGNGTQDAFWEDPSVLFVSTHQYPYYPGTGALDDIGDGAGHGFTVNMPLAQGVGNDGLGTLYEKVLWPLARRFKPQLILVSAGFDAHWRDPLAGLKLDLTGYAHLARELIAMAEELCQSRIVFILEGGYHLDALAHGVLNTLHALLGQDELIDPLGPAKAKSLSVQPLIDGLAELHPLP